MAQHNALKLFVLILCVTFNSARADAASALNLSLDTSQSPAASRIVNKAKRLLGQGIKQQLLDRYIVHTDTDSGFSGCVSLNPKATQKQTASLTKKLRQLKLNVENANSCTPPELVETGHSSGTDLAYTTLYKKTAFGGLHTATNVVVNNQADWQKLWLSANIDDALPTVDFDTNRVIGVFLGDRPDSCYSLNITSVQIVDNSKIQVSYQENLWIGGGCMQAVSQPGQLITIENAQLPVEFIALPVKYTPTDETGHNNGEDEYAVDFETLEYTKNGTCFESELYNLVIAKDRQSWQQLWNSCGASFWNEESQSFSQTQPLPEVNFDIDMVIGVRSYGGGCSIGSKIESIEHHSSGQRLVNFRLESSLPPPPDDTGYVCTADSYLIIHWVSTPKSDLPVKLNQLLTKYVGRDD